MTQPSLPTPGALLANKYRIERLLGRGGMGAVYAAQDEVLCRRVALKVLLTDETDGSQGGSQGLHRFLNEARAAARLDSEYIARVLDFGTLEGGVPFMVLEYLEGEDLARTLSTHGPLPVAKAVDFVLQACEALALAHAAGIVHRDLKPANLFLTRRPDGTSRIKVLDFGISKMGDPSNKPKALTSTSAMLGTPYYMSPEQIATPKMVDIRTDIWALGVSLYELLAGAPPFLRETLGELMFAILNEAPPPLAEKRSDVPPGLEQAIRRCLERDIPRRFGAISELAESIAPYGSGTQKPLFATQTFHGPAVAIPAMSAPARTPATPSAGGWGQASGAGPSRSRTIPMVLVGAVVATVGIAAGVAGLVAARPGARPDASGATSAPSPGVAAVSTMAAAPAAPQATPDSGPAVVPTAPRETTFLTPPPVAPPPVETLSPEPIPRETSPKERRLPAPPSKPVANHPPASASSTIAKPATGATPDQMPDNSRL